jgi:hypothetical protein
MEIDEALLAQFSAPRGRSARTLRPGSPCALLRHGPAARAVVLPAPATPSKRRDLVVARDDLRDRRALVFAQIRMVVDKVGGRHAARCRLVPTGCAGLRALDRLALGVDHLPRRKGAARGTGLLRHADELLSGDALLELGPDPSRRHAGIDELLDRGNPHWPSAASWRCSHTDAGGSSTSTSRSPVGVERPTGIEQQPILAPRVGGSGRLARDRQWLSSLADRIRPMSPPERRALPPKTHARFCVGGAGASSRVQPPYRRPNALNLLVASGLHRGAAICPDLQTGGEKSFGIRVFPRAGCDS